MCYVYLYTSINLHMKYTSEITHLRCIKLTQS